MGSIIPYITQPTRFFFIAHLDLRLFDAWKMFQTYHPLNGGVIMVMNPMVQSVKNNRMNDPCTVATRFAVCPP